MSVLHVAPEHSLLERLNEIPDINYVGGDIDAYFSSEVIDVTNLHQFADSSFDAVICNHVLEHVPDDRQAMREIRRVMKPDGWGLLLVPDVVYRTTDEDPMVTDKDERARRFGQEDHVRNYGWDYVDRLTAEGFGVTVEDQAQLFDPRTIERCRLRKLGQLEPLFVVDRGGATAPIAHSAALAAPPRP